MIPPSLPILQVKIEQIIAILVSMASAAIGWYSFVNAKMSSLETELKLKNQQLEFFEENAARMEYSIKELGVKQSEMAADIGQIKIILERKADRQ